MYERNADRMCKAEAAPHIFLSLSLSLSSKFLVLMEEKGSIGGRGERRKSKEKSFA